MTTTAAPRIDVANLNLGDRLGRGGQGSVTAINGYLVNGKWAAALKTYSPDAVRQLDTRALETITEFPGRLSPHDDRWLNESTAWPAVIAEDHGVVCGFLMRAVPPAYYFSFQTQTLGTLRKPADMAFLLNEDGYVSRSGLNVSDHDRLALLRNLAVALSRLHALGVAVGDFSPKNMLFTLSPVPSCFLIDCDGVTIGGQTVLEQADTPDWEIPHGERRATPATDAYKFGLLAIRIFARDQSSRARAALAAVSPELGQLAELSQHPDPAQRPAPGDWITALDAAAFSASRATATTSFPVTASPSRITVAIDTVSTPSSQRPYPPPATATAAPRRRGPALIMATLAGLLGTAVAVVVLIVPHLGGTGPAGSAAENAQAAQVNGLLERSAAARQALVLAVTEVRNCSDLPAATARMHRVVAQRNSELRKTSRLSADALPSGSALLSDLSQALVYSRTADKHFLAWTRQQLDRGCAASAPRTGEYQAGVAASVKARAAKTSFLQLWNPIATDLGLRTWSQAQI